jgi:threonine 3-dehydrogenase
MSGAPAAFQDILDNLCHGGRIAVLGIPSQNYPVDWQKVIFNMLTIRGVYGREMYETWYKMSVFIESGLDLSPIITHRLPIDDFQQGFDAMERGEAGKVVLDWTG